MFSLILILEIAIFAWFCWRGRDAAAGRVASASLGVPAVPKGIKTDGCTEEGLNP